MLQPANAKLVLFAALALVLLLPVAAMTDVFAASDFKKKTTFKDKEEQGVYKEALAAELKALYREIKQLKEDKASDSEITGKSAAFEDLKAHAVELIKKYDPDANPTPYIEDETLDMNAKRWAETNGQYDDTYIQQTTTVPAMASSSWFFGVQEAYAQSTPAYVNIKQGYTANCWWFPIITCDYEPSSYRYVPNYGSADLIKYTEASHPWIIPYLKIQHPTIGTYLWDSGTDISGSVTPNGYNTHAHYTTLVNNLVQKFNGPTVNPIPGCGCGNIPQNTVINTLFLLNNP